MKKYLFLSLLLVGVLLGCSKNSDEEQETRSQINKIENLQNPGESGNAFLANTNYDKIIIEIAYVTGFKPSDGALEDFVTFIKQHSFKEDIRMVYKELSSPNKEELSLQEINDIEQENRTLYNQDKTLTFYIYFTDAPSNEDNKEEDLVTLGSVYRNTSMVIYEKTIRDLADQSNRIIPEFIESPTLNHEFGHLLGLVDLGFESDIANPLKTNMVNDHQNPLAPNHCTTEGCLMQAQLQVNFNKKGTKNGNKNEIVAGCSLQAVTVLNMLQNKNNGSAKTAVDLGPECILDLKANGGR